MKKIIITSVFFLIGIIFLSGCGQQQSLEQNIINKENDKVLSQNEELKNENQIIEKKKNWVEEETLLYTIPSDHNIMKGGPAGYSCPSIYFSTDGKRFAYGGWRMNKDLNKSTGPFSIIDGKENNPVENIKEYFKNNYDIGNKWSYE